VGFAWRQMIPDHMMVVTEKQGCRKWKTLLEVRWIFTPFYPYCKLITLIKTCIYFTKKVKI
jgi:hypothetical protein